MYITHSPYIQLSKLKEGAGEVAQKFAALMAVLEVSGLIPSSCTVTQSHLQLYLQGLNTIFWSLLASHSIHAGRTAMHMKYKRKHCHTKLK